MIWINRELLGVHPAFYGSLHEFVIQFHGNISSGHFAFRHLGINECFWVGMLDGYTQHQGAAAAILCYFTGRIGITFHERNQSGRSQCGVLYRWTFRSDVWQIMSDTSTPFHQLYLFFINTDNGTVWVCSSFQTDNETVGQWCDLIVVTDTSHRASLRNDVLEMVEQVKKFLCTECVRILSLDAGHFIGDTPMHVLRRLFVDVTERVFHSIFIYPDTCGKFIAFKILQWSVIGFIVAVRFLFHFCIWMSLLSI